MAFLWVAPWGPYGGNMLGGGLQGKFLFWYFSSKEIIRFHPNLVGIILKVELQRKLQLCTNYILCLC